MTEEKDTLAQLFAACWKDETLKARFMADPKAVLAEYGMSVPEGMNIKVVENGDSHVHITMPAPPAEHMNLSDGELGDAAGGASLAWLPNAYTYCAAKCTTLDARCDLMHGKDGGDFS